MTFLDDFKILFILFILGEIRIKTPKFKDEYDRNPVKLR